MGRVVIQTKKRKGCKKASLSKEEYLSVIHAFGMLSSVGGASQRRVSEAMAHNRNTMFYDVKKPPPRQWFKYTPTSFNLDSKMLNEDLSPNPSSRKPQSPSAQREERERKNSLSQIKDEREWETLNLTTYRNETSWRMVRLGDGSIRPIEILKVDQRNKKNERKKKSQPGMINGRKVKIKKERCGYCRQMFELDNLPGGVSRMSIARLREKNNKKNEERNYKVDVKVPVKDTIPHLMRNGGCRAYEMTRVCAFCFQFFDYVDKEATNPAIKLDMDHHLPGAHHANVHYDDGKKNNNNHNPSKNGNNTITVSYPKRHKLNRPFTSSLTISPRTSIKANSNNNNNNRNYNNQSHIRKNIMRFNHSTSRSNKKKYHMDSSNINKYYNILPSSKETTPSPAALMQSIAQSQAHRIDRIRPATTTANPVRDRNKNDMLSRRRKRFGRPDITPIRPLSKSAAHPRRRKPLSRKLYQELERVPKSPYKEWMRVLNDEDGAKKGEKTQHAYYVPMYA